MSPIATIARSSTRNLKRSAKRAAWRHAFAKFAVLFVLMIPATSHASLDEPIEHDIAMFEHMRGIPDVVDAAAIFNNPAEQLMLSPVGKGLRTLLAFGGIFPQTEHAWQVLADAFNADVDQTIRSLLSRRVAVVWDGLAPDAQTDGLADAIDSQWALVCEVDPEFIKDIRESLRPAKRDIVHSRAVYAIEQGRYHIALIEPFEEGQSATVLLSPRSGTPLLHAVLSHLGNPKLADQPAKSPIVAPHEPMLAELATLFQNNNDANDWSIAFVTRLDIFSTVLGLPLPPQDRESASTIAGIVDLDKARLACTFVTNAPVDPTTPNAPIELFDALSADSVFTMVSARSPKMIITDDSLSLTMSAGATPKEPTTPIESIFNAPGVLTISQGKAREMTITACFVHNPADAPKTAQTADDAIQQLIQSFDPAQAPSFQGRFPSTPRQIDLNINDYNDHPENIWNWPGTNPKLAWLTTKTRDHDLVITSMGSSTTDPTTHAQKFAQAALTLDALDAPKRTGTLFRLSMNPEQTLRLFSEGTIADLLLAKLVQEIDVDIRRGIDAPVRGTISFELTEFASKPRLGYDAE